MLQILFQIQIRAGLKLDECNSSDGRYQTWDTSQFHFRREGQRKCISIWLVQPWQPVSHTGFIYTQNNFFEASLINSYLFQSFLSNFDIIYKKRVIFLVINPINQCLRFYRLMKSYSQAGCSGSFKDSRLNHNFKPTCAYYHVPSSVFETLDFKSSQEKSPGQNCCSYYQNTGKIQSLYFISLLHLFICLILISHCSSVT